MSQTLSRLSEDLAEVVATGSPAVVRVEARRRLPASGIVWSQDGVIVTAHHVIERDDHIRVGLPDGKTVRATLVGRDPSTDVAVLRLDQAELSAPAWADPDSLRVGNLVLAIGRPGTNPAATLGVVSALGGSWRTHGGGVVDRYLQTDVVMYPGFSGGPLLDCAGRVLGLNTSSLVHGVALTVPALTLKRVIETLLAHGRIRRAYLGVGAQPARLPEALAKQLGQETGLLLVSVEAGSPAEKAGLLLGDTIVSVDGQPTRQLDDLLGILGGDQVGQALTARVLRGGAIQETTVAPGEHK